MTTAEYQRQRRADKPETVRAMNLWRLYHIRPEEYEAMMVVQGRRCAICGIHEDDVDLGKVGGRPRKDGLAVTKAALSVDHDHACCPTAVSCGRCVRSLLCPDCNRIVGSFKDDVERMELALAYVRHHRMAGEGEDHHPVTTT